MSVKLRPFQEDTIAKMHNGCVLYGDMGVGKTITSLGYYYERVCGGQINKWGSMETPTDLYVITTAKVRDSKAFEIQAAQYGVHADSSLSTNGVRITVDSWNNLRKYTEVENAFFIFDEQRVVGYGAWSKAFIKIAKRNGWVLLSATPGDTWMDYIPVFIANGWYKHKTDFLDQHVIWTPRVKYPKVLRYQDVGTLVRRRNQVLVHMPLERHTTRHSVDVWCDYDEDAFEKVVKKRWHVFEKRPLRDVAELFSVMRKVVNSDRSRLRAVEGLLERHPRLIVFYNFDYELEMLRTLGSPTHSKGRSPSAERTTSSEEPWEYLTSPNGMDLNRQLLLEKTSKGTDTKPVRKTSQSVSETTGCEPGSSTCSSSATEESRTTGRKSTSTTSFAIAEGNLLLETTVKKERNPGFSIAEWNGHKHQEIPDTERWVYLVQYRAGSEGWNCITTDAICFFSQTYSYRDHKQAHGRIDRLNTPYVDLWYYHLVSRSIIDKAIRKALKAKKSFNERDLNLE